MNDEKKSLWGLLNPFTWLAALFGPLLRFLGLMQPPNAGGFENISKRDVEDAEKAARETEEAIDAIMRDMSPAEVVKAYARGDKNTRSTMDLSALDLESQDWLLGLSDEDLDLLGMSTTAACARSLEARAVLPAYARSRPESETPEILMIPSAEDEWERNRQHVAERFRQIQRELWLSPGVPNPNPKHTPITLH